MVLKFKRVGFLFITLLVVLSSCGTNDYKIYLLIENPEGLNLESTAKIDTTKVGKIISLNTFENKALAVLSITKDCKVPIDSKFSLIETSLIDNRKNIIIRLSDKKEYYSDNDTVYIKREESFTPIDSLNRDQLNPVEINVVNSIAKTLRGLN